MKITSAEMQMSASNVTRQQLEIEEKLNAWVGESPDVQSPKGEKVELSSGSKAALAHLSKGLDRDAKLSLIRNLIETMTGEKIRLVDAQEILDNASDITSADPSQQSDGYGVEYDKREHYSEVEQTEFSASGEVTTEDGRKINFTVGLSMSRSYQETSTTSIRLGDAAPKIDPLILNFSGHSANLSNQRFSFDLDADGKTEEISRLGAGSGFLAFDRNSDGKINNGKELFGPASGDGFGELARFDDDQNGWLDENDKMFDKLKIWQPIGQESGTLRTLKEANVGAISLNRLDTPFSIRNNHNFSLGEVRSSGVFLQENGGTGTIQHVDLSV